mgnify:FL=1
MSRELEKTKHLSVVPDASVLAALAEHSLTEDVGVRNVDHLVEDVLHELLGEVLQKSRHKKSYRLTRVSDTYKLV